MHALDVGPSDTAQADMHEGDVTIDSKSMGDGDAGNLDGQTQQASCQASTDVTPCDPGFPSTTVSTVTGQPFLTKVEVTSGSCAGSSCGAGCASLSVVGSAGLAPGAACNILVTLMDGSTQSFHVVVVSNPSPHYACCGYPLPPHLGQWVVLDPLAFDQPVVVTPTSWDGGSSLVDAPAQVF